MNAYEARALLFQRKLKSVAISDAMIDGWEDVEGAQDLAPLKGQLLLLEVKGTDATNATKLAIAPGEDRADDLLMGAALICKSLVLRDTKERLFSDTDIEAVAAFGLTVLNPLGNLVKQVSGMGPQAVQSARNFTSPIQENASNTSSVGTSAEGATPNGTNA